MTFDLNQTSKKVLCLVPVTVQEYKWYSCANKHSHLTTKHSVKFTLKKRAQKVDEIVRLKPDFIDILLNSLSVIWMSMLDEHTHV